MAETKTESTWTSTNNRNKNTNTAVAVVDRTDRSVRTKRKKTTNNNQVGGYLKYSVLMDHDILTKQEEQELGTAVQKSLKLKAALDVVLEGIRIERKARLDALTSERDDDDDDEEEEDEDYRYRGNNNNDDDDDQDALNMAHLGVYGRRQVFPYDEQDYEAQAMSVLSSGAGRMEDQERQSLLPAPWRESDKDDTNTLEDELDMLSDQQVVALFHVAGGRSELHSILIQGALAREKLIRSNVKLVVSIAKRWSQQAAKANGETAQSIYAGRHDRPSLDEAIQEGILGLTTAADRFDPERGLRFSTYATHWVTNSVRQCFQTLSVGMRVPVGYHDARSKFRTLVKNYYDAHGESPGIEELADEMGIHVKRLHLILSMTRPTLSIDAPLGSGTFSRAGQAGGAEFGNAPHIKDTLEDRDLRPEDRVELSFLRQSLENAMAQELAPHERDIVRLRLGLDDGVSRTTKQVAVACGGGLSIADVRMAEKRAFQKLRTPHALATYKFLHFIDFAGVDASTMKMR
jgi:RNA polymerase sigma factor (sigma-70 family)